MEKKLIISSRSITDPKKKPRDTINKDLRETLKQILEGNAEDLTPEVSATLSRWIKETNLEALAEWLESGGWDLVDMDQAEKRLEAAGRGVIEEYNETLQTIEFDLLKDEPGKPTGESKTITVPESKPLGSFVFDTDTKDPPFIYACLYGIPAENRDTPETQEKLKILRENLVPQAQEMARTEKTKEALANLPPPLLGREALKAGIKFFDWQGLSLFLSDKAGEDGDWLRLLAGPWINDRREKEQERLDQEGKPVSLTIRPKAISPQTGEEWTAIPRCLNFAALNAPITESYYDDYNGEEIMAEPRLGEEVTASAAGEGKIKRNLGIVPDEWLQRPSQLIIEMDYMPTPGHLREYLTKRGSKGTWYNPNNDSITEQAVKICVQERLPELCPKLLGYMFATAPISGRPVRGTLLDLAAELYPETSTGKGPTVKPWSSRHRVKSDMQAVGAALIANRGWRGLYQKEDGTLHPYHIFSVDYDLSNKPDAEINYKIDFWLAQKMQGGKGGGFFLLYMTRWLTLDAHRRRLFPLALRLSSMWDKARNRGIYIPESLKPIEGDRLAWQCNALTDDALMYRTKKTDEGKARSSLSRSRANLEKDLDALKEAGLLGKYKKIKLHKSRHGFAIIPFPPDDYAEVCRRAIQQIKNFPGKKKKEKMTQKKRHGKKK